MCICIVSGYMICLCIRIVFKDLHAWKTQTRLFSKNPTFKNRDFSQKTRLFQKTETFSKAETFSKNRDFFKKPRLFSKNMDFSKTQTFSKAETFSKNRDFFKKPRLFQKNETFSKKVDLHSKKGLIISLIDPADRPRRHSKNVLNN